MIQRRRRKLFALTVAAVLSYPLRAVADDSPPAAETPAAEAPAAVPPPWQFNHAPTCTVAGLTVELPPGYYLAESAWTKLDAELRRAQDAETRLAAENNVFRRHAEAGNLGWRGAALLVSTAFAAGAAATYYALR